MVAQLHFNLEDVDDRMAYERANKAIDMAFLLFDLTNLIHDDSITKLSTFKEKINELYETYDINLDRIIQ